MKESRYNVWVERDGASYVYNGVSGGLLRLANGDRKAVDRFLAGDPTPGCKPSLLADMAKGRMLVSDGHDELSALATLYQLTRYDTSQFGLTIVSSLGCNFDCPYCFEDKHPSIMGEEVQKAVLQVLDDQLPTIEGFGVTWFGGEPLIGKRPLLALSDAFIERCDRHDVRYSATITTNGYLLDEQTCAELRDRRVEHVQVCLDGPPDIHDRMRPLANGKGTFWHIVKNLHHAVDYLSISVRINVNTENYLRAEELLQILAAEGLSGKLTVNMGQIVATDDGVPSPSSSYVAPCFTTSRYAAAETEFTAMASRYGFGGYSVPSPSGAPCTAVRANELVVGSDGELYKCWDSVGNPNEVIGHIGDYKNINGRLHRWMSYDPFANQECQSCVALPVCMGGCAHHGMDIIQHENRCDSFRFNHHERVLAFVDAAADREDEGVVPTAQLAHAMDRR
ncbi:MAG: uncharacterized protein QOE35_2291 [Actinomycetota bacterium]|jgi:uncharacterized protein